MTIVEIPNKYIEEISRRYMENIERFGRIVEFEINYASFNVEANGLTSDEDVFKTHDDFVPNFSIIVTLGTK